MNIKQTKEPVLTAESESAMVIGNYYMFDFFLRVHQMLNISSITISELW